MKASLGRVSSLSEDIPSIKIAEDLPHCQRMGIMAAFSSFDEFSSSFSPIIDMFTSPPNTPDVIDSSFANKYHKVGARRSKACATPPMRPLSCTETNPPNNLRRSDLECAHESLLLCAQMQKKVEEPIHILNIGIRVTTVEPDDHYATLFGDFCANQVKGRHSRGEKTVLG